MGLPCEAAWAKECAVVLKELGVKPQEGLSAEAVEQRRAEHGFNELNKEPGTPIWKLIAEQFNDTLVKVRRAALARARARACVSGPSLFCARSAASTRTPPGQPLQAPPPHPPTATRHHHPRTQILLLSAGISFALAFFDEGSKGEGLRAYVEPFVILLILFLNAAVGVWQESRSEAALEALKELQGETAKVLRGGKLVRPPFRVGGARGPTTGAACPSWQAGWGTGAGWVGVLAWAHGRTHARTHASSGTTMRPAAPPTRADHGPAVTGAGAGGHGGAARGRPRACGHPCVQPAHRHGAPGAGVAHRCAPSGWWWWW